MFWGSFTSSPALVDAGRTVEGRLELEHERRVAGGAGLVPTCGAHGTRWSRSGSAPGASAGVMPHPWRSTPVPWHFTTKYFSAMTILISPSRRAPCVQAVNQAKEAKTAAEAKAKAAAELK